MKVFMDFSPSIQKIFTENKIDLQELISVGEESLVVEYEYLSHEQDQSERSKSLLPVVIIGTLGIVALTAVVKSITDLIDTVHTKPYWMEFTEIEAIVDEEGKAIRDAEGNPILKETKKYELVESKNKNVRKEILFNLNLKNGIVFKIITDRNKEN